MIDKNKEIKVVNRTSGIVGYTIPDMGNLHRSYTARETKTVTFEEMQKLSYLISFLYIIIFEINYVFNSKIIIKKL